MFRRTMVLVGVLACASLARAQDATPKVRPEALLPAGTLFFAGTDDLAALVAKSRSSPFGKILAEQEVKDFLQKPMADLRKAIDAGVAHARQLPALAQIDLDIDKILAGDYGRVFVAITHLGIDATKKGPAAVDIGLVVGLEAKPGAIDVIGMVKQIIAGVAEEGTGGKMKMETIEVEGISYDRMKSPEAPQALCFTKAGGLSLFSLAEADLVGIAKRAAGDTGGRSLLADPDFTRCVAAVGKPASGDVVVYMHVGRLCEQVRNALLLAMDAAGEVDKKAIVEKIYDALGLRGFGPMYGTSTWRDGAAVSIAYHESDPQAGGLATLSELKPIDRELIKLVPKEALGFSISSFDLAPIYDMLMDGLKGAAPDIYGVVTQKIQEFETMVAGADAQGNPNWDVRRDLIGSIGGRMMSVSMPGAGTAFGPGGDTIFWCETSNPAALEKSLGYLFALPGQLAGTPVNFKEQMHGDVKLKVLDTMSLGPLAMMAGSMQPTWCIHNGRFWFSTTTKSLKKALDAATTPPVENITAKADFAKRWVEPPKDAVVTSISYGDTATNFENGYTSILGLLPMLTMGLQQQGMDELPFDMQFLPTAETISQHLFGTVDVSYKVGNNGHISMSRGPFGVEAGIGIALGAGAFGGMMAYQNEMKARKRSASVAERAVEAPGDPAVQAKRDLADLSASITVHIIEFGNPPGTLSELIKVKPDYPLGVLNRKALPKDPWGHDYAYGTDGKETYTIWSFGPNGVDESGGGDDIVLR